MTALARPLARAIADGRRAVLVTVAQVAGSVPREAGASMLVEAAAMHGTIGGGHLEYEALRIAREAIAGATPSSTWLVRFPLAARLGQCCGGVATLAFALVDAGGDWLDAAAGCERAITRYAIVHRVGASAARLAIAEDAAHGTLGDAALDVRAVALARAALGAGPGASCVEADGTALVVQVVDPASFDVVVFGNGHVGRALVAVLAAAGARVRWVDAREHDFPAAAPAGVEVVATDDPVGEVALAPRGAHLVVTTHNHALDFDIVEAALARDDWAYLGLIGSRAKRAQFEKRLAARGRPASDFARVTCPIGAGSGLRGKAPGTIAVATAAELLKLREAAAAAGDGRAAAPAGNAGAGRERA